MKRNARPAEAILQWLISPVTRREAALFAIVLTAGTLLRIVALSRSAVEHFDEGVYASNIFFGPPDYAYPLQRFFGPPLLPVLIETGMIAGLPPNPAAMLPSFLAGCGTIVALWSFGRFWLGPAVGIAVATLAALSGFHVAFSATALTDVLLGLWLLLAVDAIGRSLLNSDYRWAAGAGLFTGLAWWTKYNGWLPLAIEAAALPLLWIFLRPPAKQLRTWLGCFAVTVAVALAVWAPYYLSLQSQGGYGPIAANHAKYFVGLAGWYESARRQAANFFAMDGGYTGAAILVAWMLAAITPAPSPQQDANPQRRRIGHTLIGVWWLGMMVATPLYWPYARLLVPGVLATSIGAALLFELLLRQPRQRFVAGVVSVLAIVAAMFGLGRIWASQLAATTGDRQALMHIAANIKSDHDLTATLPARDTDRPTRAIYVVAEPAIFFQLKAAGEPVVGPVQDVPIAPATVGGQPVPTLLVTGLHAARDLAFQEQWSAAKDRWELVKTFDYKPSSIVWLDLNDARKPPDKEVPSDDQVRLYRLKE